LFVSFKVVLLRQDDLDLPPGERPDHIMQQIALTPVHLEQFIIIVFAIEVGPFL
jgi:hypothetical protein